MDYLSNKSIERLANAAGVTQLSSLSYDEIKYMIKGLIGVWLNNIIILADYSNKKIVTSDMVKYAFERSDFKSAIPAIHHKDLKACSIYKDDKNLDKREKMEDKLRFYQDQHDCVFFSKNSFIKALKNFNEAKGINMKWTPNAITLVHVATESFLIDLLEDSVRVLIHSGHKILRPKDINLVRVIRKLDFDSFY